MDVRAQPETVIQLVPGKGPWPRIDLSRSFHCAAVAGAPEKVSPPSMGCFRSGSHVTFLRTHCVQRAGCGDDTETDTVTMSV